MNKLLKVAISILLVVATVCFTGCKKTDEPNNGGNNGNNGGNGSETPEAPAIVSTSEVQYDGTIFIEAVFEDESKMYFAIISPTEMSVASGEFFYHDNPSLAYKYRGEVVIPESITHLSSNYTVATIGFKAFYRCDLVTSVTIPQSVKYIYGYKGHDPYSNTYGAFENCSNLKCINIDKIRGIDKKAFWGCPFDTIIISKGIKAIGIDAFSSKHIIFNADSCYFAGDLDYSENPIGAPNCFSAFPNMNSISFGTNVKVFPGYLFSNMNPTAVEIPSSVTILAAGAFYRCTRLSSIVIPNLVAEIGDEAFYYCTNLASITCMATEPPILGEHVFANCHIEVIYVPSASVEAYKTADGWSRYADVIVGI